MNNFSRTELARLLAFQLREWIDDTESRGMLPPAWRTTLEAVADSLVIDAELGIVYQVPPAAAGSEHPDT